MDKFVVTPDKFNNPNGFYIVCKSQEVCYDDEN